MNFILQKIVIKYLELFIILLSLIVYKFQYYIKLLSYNFYFILQFSYYIYNQSIIFTLCKIIINSFKPYKTFYIKLDIYSFYIIQPNQHIIFILYKIVNIQFLHYDLFSKLYKIIAQLALYKYTSFKITTYIIKSNLSCILRKSKN